VLKPGRPDPTLRKQHRPKMNPKLMSPVLCAALLVGGCATSVEMTPESRSSVRTISMQPQIPIGPIRVMTMGRALSIGLSGVLGGAVGGAIVGGAQATAKNEPADQMTEAMAKNGIRIDQVFRDEFIRQVGEKHPFKLVDGEGDDQLVIVVPIWGLSVPDPYQYALRPIVTAIAILKDPSGKVVWKDVERSSELNFSVPRHTLGEFQANPEFLREGFRKASETVVGKLLDNYAGK